METEPIRFRPLYMERVWGGRSLETCYGRKLPNAGVPYGESWEIVDRPEAQSVVDGGEYDGKSLHDLWTHHREAVFGGGEGARFPLLLKILDAREKLSVQVHPPAAVAAGLGGEPKTEIWYVAAADPGATLYLGLREGVSKEAFIASIAEGTAAEQLHQVTGQAGESIFIPSGRLHAIGAGYLIFEIQQNSDTTYRVFDWNRVGLDGKPRDLHVEESVACIDFEDTEPGMDAQDRELLADCPEFRVERWELEGRRRANADGGFSIIAVVEGEVRCGSSQFRAGDFFLIPADQAPAELIPLGGSSTVLCTTLPTR